MPSCGRFRMRIARELSTLGRSGSSSLPTCAADTGAPLGGFGGLTGKVVGKGKKIVGGVGIGGSTSFVVSCVLDPTCT
jgi:hypothetical protein